MNDQTTITVYVVGMIEHDNEAGVHVNTQIIGVFDDAEKAASCCRTPLHFLGPIALNVDLGDDIAPWPGAYFPMIGSPS